MPFFTSELVSLHCLPGYPENLVSIPCEQGGSEPLSLQATLALKPRGDVTPEIQNKGISGPKIGHVSFIKRHKGGFLAHLA